MIALAIPSALKRAVRTLPILSQIGHRIPLEYALDLSDQLLVGEMVTDDRLGKAGSHTGAAALAQRHIDLRLRLCLKDNANDFSANLHQARNRHLE